MGPSAHHRAPLPHAFWILLTGDTLSTFGVSVYTLIVLYLVQHFSSNILLNGFVGALSHVPAFFAGIGLGLVVDRVSRKSLMVWANSIVALMAWVPGIANLHTTGGYTVVIATDVVVQTALYWEQLSHNAYLKFLVDPDQLARSEGLLQSIAAVGFAGAMMVVFFTIGQHPVRRLLGLSAGLAAIVALITGLGLPHDAAHQPDKANGLSWPFVKEGLRWINGFAPLRWYVYQTIFANAAINVLMALIIYDMGHHGFFHTMPILAIVGAGAGMGLAGVTLSWLAARIPLVGLIAVGRVAFALGLWGIATTDSLYGLAISLALVFWGQNVSGTALVTWRTRVTPLAVQGRISSTISQISAFTSWLGVVGVSALDQVAHSVALGFEIAAGMVGISLVVILVGVGRGHWPLPRYLEEAAQQPSQQA
ncbi:MAG: hypothetical protein C7B47_15525 [Sulfobacillus thermosulfidooxidans]|uniref:MFS transporter n=1 Tax=Sulfobacillus thermosulfidooxidans TaxID=28034 RepID=A0A2T2WP72_SULTH|nr:MAG: hypothetical protein C7B47_15525 [Sulfobacillus thermosulfidooxidans]